MVEQENFGLDKKREKLLRELLGAHLDWVKPEIFRTIGPFEPKFFEIYAAETSPVISRCVAWLEERSDDEIAVLLGDGRKLGLDLEISWPKELVDLISDLRDGPPPWYSGGFGHPDYQADFDYWSKMARFSRHELLCLSVGIEPNSIDAAKIKRMHKKDTSDDLPPETSLVVM